MMMSAMRRSGSSLGRKKTSAKAKRRSRSAAAREDSDSEAHRRAQSRPDDRAASRYDDRATSQYDDRAASRLEDRATSQYDNSATSHYDDRAASRLDDRATSRYDDRAASRLDERSESRLDDRSESRLDDRAMSRLDDRAMSRLDERPESSVNDRPVSRIDERSESRLSDGDPLSPQHRAVSRVDSPHGGPGDASEKSSPGSASGPEKDFDCPPHAEKDYDCPPHADVADSGIDSGNGVVEPEKDYDCPPHADVADSGIDSGNGVVEPESPTRKPRGSSSSEVNDEEDPSTPDKDYVILPAVSVTHHPSAEVARKRPPKHKHRKGKGAGAADQAPTATESPRQPCQDATPDERSTATESPRQPSQDATPDERSTAENQTECSVEKSADNEQKAGRPDNSSEDGADGKQHRSTDVSENKNHKATPSDTKATSDSLETTAPSSDSQETAAPSSDSQETAVDSQEQAVLAKKKKKKLEARLAQAKHSLESPHVDAAVDAFEMAEGPLLSPPNTQLVREFRRLFQQELTRLRTELDTFRRFCGKQMEKETGLALGEKPADKEATQNQVSEEVVSQREDHLADRIKDLQEYEKDILEVEIMLNDRQAICERRQSALLTLDEELQNLRDDIFDKKDNVRNEADTSTERARKNWDFVRRNLTDKHAMLEATIQRHRTQIAAANASLAAKDSLVAHLQKRAKEAQDGVKSRDRRVQQLEHKLVLATQQLTHQGRGGPASPAKHMSALPSTSSSPEPVLGRPPTRAGSAMRPQSALQRQTSQPVLQTSQTSALGTSARRMSVQPDSALVPTGDPRGRRMSTHHPDIPIDVIIKNQRHNDHSDVISREGSVKRKEEGYSNGVNEGAGGSEEGRGAGGGRRSSVSRGSHGGSLRRHGSRRARSASSSMANTVTNASAACNIL